MDGGWRVLRACLLAVATVVMVAGCSGDRSSTPDEPLATGGQPVDVRTLPSVGDIGPLVGWSDPKVVGGFLRIDLTSTGVCASVVPNDWEAPTTYFLWPDGYQVNRDQFFTVTDEKDRWVASDGDYVWVKARSTGAHPDQELARDCPMRRGHVAAVTEVSNGGRPFGHARRPVMVMAGCANTDPQVRPQSLVLACDGGLLLDRVHWSTWGRNGATGTGRLALHCYDPVGADRMPVSFSYGKALHDPQDQFGLRLLEDIDIQYPREPCL